MSVIDAFISGVLATSLLEWLAVLTSILYVIFAARKQIVCWFFALVTSALYIVICYVAQLYIETILQVFYFVMAIVGWWSWKQSSNEKHDILKWGVIKHILNIVISGIIAFSLGYIFDVYTNQMNPYLDAFTTCYSLLATFMVTKKVLENWVYWIVIDAVSIYLYASRSLYLSAVLFLFFTILALVGYLAWRKQFKLQQA